jgi:hypothetical protein
VGRASIHPAFPKLYRGIYTDKSDSTGRHFMKGECIEEVTITVFPPMEGIGIANEVAIVEEDACGESTSADLNIDSSEEGTPVITLGPKSLMKRINKALEAAKETYGDGICIRRADYSSEEGIGDSIEWINAALRGSGNTAVLDEQKFSEFIGTSAPIITVNNRLAFVGVVPTIPQFLSRIGAAIRMVREP